MAKQEEFIEVVNTFKTVSPSITDIQRRGLLKQAVQNYDLSVEEATEILKSLGLVVGEDTNFFEILGLSIEEIQKQDNKNIKGIVEEAHDRFYRASLRAGARIRSDGKTEEQWRNILNQARDTLIDTHKRTVYLETFLQENSPVTISSTIPEHTIQNTHTDITQETELDTIPTENSITNPMDVSVPTDMVLILPGEFQMGNHGEDVNNTAIPPRTVFVDTFLIDKYPVTNGEYKVFLDENLLWRKDRIDRIYHNGKYLTNWNRNNFPKGKANYPVVNVSWHAAMAYAQWVKKRLPTDTEWEKAARGGLSEKIYSWGDDINMSMANYGMVVGSTTPVGQYPPNDYGVYDMTGNVWEWCLNKYDINASLQNPSTTPKEVREIVDTFLNIDTYRVLRGGSWASSEHSVRVAYSGRAAPRFTYYSYGFRCVKDISC